MEYNYTYTDVEKIISDIKQAIVILKNNSFENVNWEIYNSPKGNNNEYNKLDWFDIELLDDMLYILTGANFFNTKEEIPQYYKEPYHTKESTEKFKKDIMIKNKVKNIREQFTTEYYRILLNNETAVNQHFKYIDASKATRQEKEKRPNDTYTTYQTIKALYPQKER